MYWASWNSLLIVTQTRFKVHCRALTESYLQELSPVSVMPMGWAVCSEQTAFVYSITLNGELFRAIIRGEFNISGFQNRNLRRYFSGKSAHQVSRLLKRLQKHGLIKKIANTYKYYLTTLGRKVTATTLKLREMYIIPSLRGVIVRWTIFHDHFAHNFIYKRLNYLCIEITQLAERHAILLKTN